VKHRPSRLTFVLVALSTVGAPANVTKAQTGLATHHRQSDVIYGRKFGVALTLEVFTPPERNGAAVVWVVSSGGRSSRDQTLQPSFERRVSPLLDRGYTVFAVIHGSSPVFHAQDYVLDVRRAVRFVRQRAADFQIDAQRLAIAGSSSGGLIALIVAMQADQGDSTASDAVDRESSRVQAVGCFFSPTDLTDFGERSESVLDYMRRQSGSVDPSFQFYESADKAGTRVLITDREQLLRILREMSPVTHVTSDDPPTILIHGDADKAIPIEQSRRLFDRLSKANVPSRLVEREAMGHAWPGWESETALLADWFDTHLR
jgi:dipeptidyl aminopeptidase/acylaminoacyl peptidase